VDTQWHTSGASKDTRNGIAAQLPRKCSKVHWSQHYAMFVPFAIMTLMTEG